MKTNTWITSSACETGDCVEVMACDTGACVEVFASTGNGDGGGMVYVKKNSFTYGEWRAFVKGVRAGEFDV
jgi:hypothetical protein